MSTFYNQLRSLKGTAIGTITTWAGDIGTIPPGWILCNGNGLSVVDYPDLFAIIGYQYGGSGETFLIPRLQDKCIADYHPSHSAIGGIELNPDFVERMGENEANLTSGATSNIDLYLSLTPVNRLSARVTGMSINASGYSDDISLIPRALGDHHMASHSHFGTAPSIEPSGEYAERCQNETLTNCGFFQLGFSPCQDNCSDFEYWPSEANGNRQWSSFLRPTEPTSGNINMGVWIRSGATFTRTDSAISSWPSIYLYGQLELQNSPNKNYMISDDDTVEQGANNAGNDLNSMHPYPVHLNHPGVNFGGTPSAPSANTGNAVVSGGSQVTAVAISGHDHPSLNYAITLGNVRAPNIIATNNISTGNVSPINSSLVGIGSFRMDNVDTPSLNVIHIIRAY